MKFRRSKISKKTFWIIGAFVFVVLGYFLYRSFAVREGQEVQEEVLFKSSPEDEAKLKEISTQMSAGSSQPQQMSASSINPEIIPKIEIMKNFDQELTNNMSIQLNRAR